ncbi:MAG TPA: dienelactone hydrolase family protein, partial [Roseiarcus sp.]|nr:dienelactone hydrolase family protein [Roseiarcus sp.]
MGEPVAINGQSVDYRDEAITYEGYLSLPAANRKRLPCVLLGHDWSGLRDGIRRVADRIAGLGVACFAFDVYGKGNRGDPRGDNSRLMKPVVDSEAKCNPVDSIGSSTKSRVSHSERRPSARFPGDKDGSARRNIEP